MKTRADALLHDPVASPTKPASSPGRAAPTQRHAARFDEPTRQAQHTILDAAWTAPVQLARDSHTGLDDAEIQTAAAHGVASGGGALPHLDAIQRSFGDHDVTSISAHVGGAAKDASHAIGAHAYATGNHVAFAETPDLFLAAHEAAHVVQQRSGVQLSSSVGQAGDTYEQHADAVAARVVAGESAADLLDAAAGAGAVAAAQRSAVQRDEIELGPPGGPGTGHAPRRGPSTADRVRAGGARAAKAWMGAIPYLDAAMKSIQAIAMVWDWLKPGGQVQDGILLDPQVSAPVKRDFDRVLRYRVAESYIETVIAMGRNAGIDFTTWKNGQPPPSHASHDADGDKPHVAGPEPKSELPPQVAEFLKELRAVQVASVHDKVQRNLEREIAAGEAIRADPETWFWNGAGMHGRGDPEAFESLAGLGNPIGGIGSDVKTWGKLTYWLDCGILQPTFAGIPPSASHFGLAPDVEFVKLTWFRGGVIVPQTSEAMLDDLKILHHRTAFKGGINEPTGAYESLFQFVFDDSQPFVTLTATFRDIAGVPVVLLDALTRGRPET